jgi:ribosome-binding protein aMBF1 (putative translation factor)
MPTCKACGEDVDELVSVNVSGRRRKLCEDCAADAQQNEEILKESESVVQQMLGFKGRR